MQELSPDELKQKLDGGANVFLKIWQRGCGPCKMSASATTRMEQANPHNLEFVSICSDDHPEILELTGAKVMPAFFVFHAKELRGKFEGFKGQAKLEEFVAEAMKQ